MQMFSADIAREIVADRVRQAGAARAWREARRAAQSAQMEASAQVSAQPVRVIVLPEAQPAQVREPERVSS